MNTQAIFARALLALLPALIPAIALAQVGRQNCSAVTTKTCDIAHALGKGINMGDMLDAPNEGDWGVVLYAEYIPLVSQKFKTIRLPVRWSNHAALTADATLDETFAKRVDTIVDAFLAQGKYVILDVHHYHQLDGKALDAKEASVAPEVVAERFYNIWDQLARRYANRSDQLIFEIYNEPFPKPEPWDQIAAKALTIIRKSNPERVVMLGPVGNYPTNLARLVIPADKNLIVPFHSYVPFAFTHQGISYMPQFPKGVTCCSTAQRKEVADQFDLVAKWNLQRGYPVHVGEFGSVKVADTASRVEYTRLVRQYTRQYGFGWTYWDFAHVFGVFDPKTKTWNEPLLDALMTSNP